MDGQDMGSAIQEIERLASEARKTSILEVKGEPAGTYYLVGPDGKAELKVAAAAFHGEKLASPLELKRFAAARGKDESHIFYDDARVIFVYDLDDRRDRATCELKTSAQFDWLTQRAGTALCQADFIRLLRITFRGCLPPDSNLLPLVRQLRFTSNAEAEGNIQHGRESLGKQVTKAVTGIEVIPEEIVLRVPVFENHNYLAAVACAVEVLPHEQAFRLTPFPLEVRRAMDATMQDIAHLLSDDGLPPLYRGQPS